MGDGLQDPELLLAIDFLCKDEVRALLEDTRDHQNPVNRNTPPKVVGALIFTIEIRFSLPTLLFRNFGLNMEA